MALSQIEQDLYNKISGQTDQALIAGALTEARNAAANEVSGFRTAIGNVLTGTTKLNQGQTLDLGNGYSLKLGTYYTGSGQHFNPETGKYEAGDRGYDQYSLMGADGSVLGSYNRMGGMKLEDERNAFLDMYAKAQGINPYLLKFGSSAFNDVGGVMDWYNANSSKYAPLTQTVERQAPGTGAQLSDAEMAATVKAGNAAFTAQTGGFKPSDPAALAAAGTMTSETVKPEFQVYDPKTGQTLTGQQAYDMLQGEPSADILAGKTDIPDLASESDKMNVADAAAATAQYYGKPRVQDLAVEQNAAKELVAFLDSKKAGDKTLRQTITADNWSKYVNAYLYGGYTLQDIANDLYSRATGKGGGIVHPTIGRNEWLAANPQLTGATGATGSTGTATGGTGTTGAGTAGTGAGAGTNAGAGAPTITDIKKDTITNNPTAGGAVNDNTDFDGLNAKLTEIQNEILTRQQYYDQQEEIIKNKTGSQTGINRELSKLSQEKNKELAFLEMRQSIAQGNFDRAREIAKENQAAAKAADEQKVKLWTDDFVQIDDDIAKTLDPTQYLELSDGSKWLKDTTGTALDNISIDNWAKNILDGSASIGNVPDDMRTSVNDRVKALIDTGYVSMTPLQKEQMGKISGELRQEPMYRDMVDIMNGYKSVEVGYSFDNGAGDLTMINGFQRMIDPGSVVREGEFANVESASGWLDKFLNLGGKITTGSRMTTDARDAVKASGRQSL